MRPRYARTCLPSEGPCQPSLGPSTTVRDRVLLREAAVNISSRAARLSAMGVASLLQLQEWDGAAG